MRANDGGKACIAATWHETFVSGTHDRPSGQVRPLWEAMHDMGGDLVLAGHDHHYERFARLGRSGTATASGMRQFVVGTGGKSLAGFNHVLSGSQVRHRAYGVLAVDLKAGGYSWRFHSVPGTNFSDSGQESCR